MTDSSFSFYVCFTIWHHHVRTSRNRHQIIHSLDQVLIFVIYLLVSGISLHRKLSFPLRISSVNVTRSAASKKLRWLEISMYDTNNYKWVNLLKLILLVVFTLKVQSCKLLTALLFKLLSRKIFFINRKDNKLFKGRLLFKKIACFTGRLLQNYK